MVLKSTSLGGQFLLVVMFAAASLSPSTAVLAQAQSQDKFAIDSPLPPKIVSGEVIVHFRPGITDEARDQSLAAVNGVFLRPLELQDAVIAKVPDGTEVLAAQSLEVDPNVLSAEPNGNLRMSELP